MLHPSTYLYLGERTQEHLTGEGKLVDECALVCYELAAMSVSVM